MTWLLSDIFWPFSAGQRWKKLREEVSAAVEGYAPCSSANCSCHLRCVSCLCSQFPFYNPAATVFLCRFVDLCFSVLQNDLRPFKGKISQDLMAMTLQRGVGTHYQIIGHKLYRERNCMFPARWGKTVPVMQPLLSQIYFLLMPVRHLTHKIKRHHHNTVDVFSSGFTNTCRCIK